MHKFWIFLKAGQAREKTDQKCFTYSVFYDTVSLVVKF